MLRNKEALRELSKSRRAGCTGSRWGQLDWGMHLHDEGNFMEGVSNDRHCNNAGCGTGVFRTPGTEMPWLFFHALLLRSPPPAPCITKRDYTFLVNHLWCVLGFLSLRIGFLEDAPSPSCRRFQSIFTKYLSDKREIWQPRLQPLEACNLYSREIFKTFWSLLWPFFYQLLSFLSPNFCFRSILLKQRIFLHRNIFILRIFD